MKNRKINLITALIFLLFAVSAQAQNDTLRVLFIGNSHTYFNNLPHMFAFLSQSGGYAVEVDSNTPGGYTLEGHCTNQTTLDKINQGGWDFVVLQEQSAYPTIDFYRYGSMYPAARHLDSLIIQHGEHTALYMTWGWRGGGQRDIDGHYSVPFVDYFQMQDTVTAAYVMLRDILSSVLLPAGNAWARAMRTDTTLDLWSPNDNYHPNLMGSYLAACVFYATFFHQSPIGLSYTAGLTRQQADFFQLMADQTVSSIGNEVAYVPSSFELLQNYPNPFNGRTTINLNRAENVQIGIFDIDGRLITTLSTENGNAVWDASDLSSGLYFARLTNGQSSNAIKMVLLK
jgi:hypothetical protein